jgi:hypothetical protein
VADGRPLPALISAFDALQTRHLTLPPVSLGALHRLFVSRLGLALTRPALRRVAEVSSGNPFFALEVGRGLQEPGVRPGLHDPLPVPDTLAGLLGKRVDALAPEVHEALLVAALAADPPSRPSATRSKTTAGSGFVLRPNGA